MLLCNRINQMSPSELLVFGIRMTFGPWLLYVGLIKWIKGADNFIGYITTQFAETWLPAQLVLLSAWVILVAEPLIGAWIISGIKGRWAWILAAKLMFLLVFGQTVIMGDKIADIWIYLIICLFCAAFSSNSSKCCASAQCTS